MIAAEKLTAAEIVRRLCPQTWREWLKRDLDFETHYRPLFKMAISWCGSDRTILDVGCGAGQHVAAFHACRVRATGIDRHIPDEGLANAKAVGYQLVTGRWEDIESDAFDAVWSHHVLEHARDPLSYLEEWARIVRPGGKLFLAVPKYREDALPGHVNTGWSISQAVYMAALGQWDCSDYRAVSHGMNILLAASKPSGPCQRYSEINGGQWSSIADQLTDRGTIDWGNCRLGVRFMPNWPKGDELDQ